MTHLVCTFEILPEPNKVSLLLEAAKPDGTTTRLMNTNLITEYTGLPPADDSYEPLTTYIPEATIIVKHILADWHAKWVPFLVQDEEP
jgi:hypothetical protein